MRPFKIRVTQEHIDNGIQGSCWNCPIALAFDEVTKRLGIFTPFRVTVDAIDVLVWLPFDDYGHWISVPLSRRARKFVKKFDDNKPVEPITFLFDPEWRL